MAGSVLHTGTRMVSERHDPHSLCPMQLPSGESVRWMTTWMVCSMGRWHQERLCVQRRCGVACHFPQAVREGLPEKAAFEQSGSGQ